MTAWLIDKSALVRLGSSPEAAEWVLRIRRGLVRISTLTRLEIGFSARSARDIRRSFTEPAIIGPPSIPDLLISATAELSRLTVLHVGKDFETDLRT